MVSLSQLKYKFRREALKTFYQSLKEAYPTISRGTLLQYTCLTLITVIAFIVRILPLRWGAYLSEFDPYYHYRVTEYVVKNWQSVFTQSFWEWHDYQSWYPGGREIWANTPPGLPFTGAFFHILLTSLGFRVTVLDVCIFFPPLMGTITCLALYFFAKDIGGKEVGFLSALILSLNAAHISRTYLGFYKHETIGIFTIVLISLLFLRSIEPEKPLTTCVLYSLAAGLALGYLDISWGAFYYAMDLLALFVILLIFLRRYSPRLLVAYSVTLGLSLFIAIRVPRPGLAVLTSSGTLPAVAAFFLLILAEVLRHIKTTKMKLIAIGCLASSMLVLALLLLQTGIIAPVAGKVISVLNPVTRVEMPIVESVAEHRSATWTAFYYQFGFLLILGMMGFFFALQKPTNKNIYLILFCATSLYFASSMVRLTLILAPAFCVLSALAIIELTKPFIDIAKGVEFFPRRKIRFISRVSPEFGVVAVALIFMLVFMSLSRGVESAYEPVTIASSTIPTRQFVGDWLEACSWIHDNTPEGAVICCWWDYGYYITTIGNRTTLADNSTWNTTQIEYLGRIYMYSESEALPLLQRYGVTHILVFTTLNFYLKYGQPIFYGDEVKWMWMARIAGLDENELKDETLSRRLGVGEYMLADYGIYLPKADTLFTRLTLYGVLKEGAYDYGVSPPAPRFGLKFSSSASLVFIYEVNYAGE